MNQSAFITAQDDSVDSAKGCSFCKHSKFDAGRNEYGETYVTGPGKCVINPPVIVDSVFKVVAESNPDQSIDELVELASHWPVVWHSDRCSKFEHQ